MPKNCKVELNTVTINISVSYHRTSKKEKTTIFLQRKRSKVWNLNLRFKEPRVTQL